jgi:hypothetical protein
MFYVYDGDGNGDGGGNGNGAGYCGNNNIAVARHLISGLRCHWDFQYNLLNHLFYKY